MTQYVKEVGSKNWTVGTMGASTDATQLSTGYECNELLVQNDPDNAEDILLGTSTGQVIQLKAGQSITIPCLNVNSVYVKTVNSTATVNWLARK